MPKKIPKCKYCGNTQHFSIACFNKPRRPIKNISDKALNKKQVTDRLWYQLNPPDSKGVWICYLQISSECPIKLTRSTIVLEHYKSKARHPELKFEVTNLRPSCSLCNDLKRSLDIEDLVKDYPRLQRLLT